MLPTTPAAAQYNQAPQYYLLSQLLQSPQPQQNLQPPLQDLQPQLQDLQPQLQLTAVPQYAQQLPTMFSQPYPQPYVGTTQPQPLQPPNILYKGDVLHHVPNTRQTLYLFQPPDLPGGAANSDPRGLPSTLGTQNPPPHALLPRMLQQVQYPYLTQANDYFSGPQPGIFQQQDLHFYVPPMVSYYQGQHPNQHSIGGNTANANTLPQYLQLLHLGTPQTGPLQQPSMYNTTGSSGSSSSSSNYPGLLQNMLHNGLLASSLLTQFQYPMNGQVGALPSGLLAVHLMPQAAQSHHVHQGSYTPSPTLRANPAAFANKMYDNNMDPARGQYGGAYVDPNMPKLGQGVKKNQCPVCHKVFKRPSSLQIHFYIHTGVKLYKCEWEGCGRLFNVKSNMTRHYKLHLKNDKG